MYFLDKGLEQEQMYPITMENRPWYEKENIQQKLLISCVALYINISMKSIEKSCISLIFTSYHKIWYLQTLLLCLLDNKVPTLPGKSEVIPRSTVTGWMVMTCVPVFKPEAHLVLCGKWNKCNHCYLHPFTFSSHSDLFWLCLQWKWQSVWRLQNLTSEIMVAKPGNVHYYLTDWKT